MLLTKPNLKQMDDKLFQGVLALGKSELCFDFVSGEFCKAIPPEYLPLEWAGPCGAMIMAISCEEGMAAK